MRFFMFVTFTIILSFIGIIAYHALKPNVIEEGDVVKKIYHEEENFVTMMPMTISTGKTTTTTFVPIFHHYPESWQIVIQKYDEEQGKMLKEDFYISKEDYDALEIGDYYRYVDGEAYNDRPKEERDATPEEEEKLMREE